MSLKLAVTQLKHAEGVAFPYGCEHFCDSTYRNEVFVVRDELKLCEVTVEVRCGKVVRPDDLDLKEANLVHTPV